MIIVDILQETKYGSFHNIALMLTLCFNVYLIYQYFKYQDRVCISTVNTTSKTTVYVAIILTIV
jgi:hypothetical protein